MGEEKLQAGCHQGSPPRKEELFVDTEFIGYDVRLLEKRYVKEGGARCDERGSYYINNYSLLTAKIPPEYLFVLRPEHDPLARNALSVYAALTTDLALADHLRKVLADLKALDGH